MKISQQILISIIVPVFNEEKTIDIIIKKLHKLKKLNFIFEIIVVNDGSTDKTEKKILSLKKFINKYISNSENKGKGFAIKKGMQNARGKYIFFQDADLEYDPEDILKFFNLIKKFEPDLIIGSRLNYSDYTRSHNFFNKLANKLITNLFNIINNTTFTDVYSCYACFKKDLIDSDKIISEGFSQHAEILSKVIRKGNKFYEVPINYNGRTYAEGKKIKFYHIIPVIYQILKCRFI
jgi:glycosyltransferase involved in cell wall biosynthesis